MVSKAALERRQKVKEEIISRVCQFEKQTIDQIVDEIYDDLDEHERPVKKTIKEYVGELVREGWLYTKNSVVVYPTAKAKRHVAGLVQEEDA